MSMTNDLVQTWMKKDTRKDLKIFKEEKGFRNLSEAVDHLLKEKRPIRFENEFKKRKTLFPKIN